MNAQRYTRFFAIPLLMGLLLIPTAMAEQKYERIYNAQAHKYEYVPVEGLGHKTLDYLKAHPVVRDSAVGAAAGIGASALSGESSLLKGAGVGALAGAGTGLVSSSKLLHGKPLVKSSAEGAIIGTGASTIFGKSKLKGAAVGAAAGAGAHYLRKYVLDKNY